MSVTPTTDCRLILTSASVAALTISGPGNHECGSSLPGQKREERDIGIALADTDSFAQHRDTWAVTHVSITIYKACSARLQSLGKCTP